MAYVFQAIPADLSAAELPQFSPVQVEADRSRRLVNVFLSTLIAVPEFRTRVLQLAGARVFGGRADIFGQVRFRAETDEKGGMRPPDGLIRFKGAGAFSALIEAHGRQFDASSAEDVARIARSLRLSRERRVQRVIAIAGTVPDQSFLDALRSDPSSPPVDRLKSLTWMETIDAAFHLLDRKVVRAPAAVFLLEQYIRFLKEEAIRDLQARAERGEGAILFNSLGGDWAGLVRDLREGKPIDQRDPRLSAAAANWLSYLRFLALFLTRGQTREEDALNNPNVRIQNLALRKDAVRLKLKQEGRLQASFKKADEVTPTLLAIDLKEAQLSFRIEIAGPPDNSPAIERIKALAAVVRDDRTTGATHIKIFWPQEKGPRTVTREQALRDPIAIAPPAHDMVPEKFIIERKVALGPLAVEPEGFVQLVMLELRGFRASVREVLKRGLPEI